MDFTTLLLGRRPRLVAVFTAIVVSAAALVSCAADNYADRRDQVVDVPDHYSTVDVTGPSLDRWCTDFGAPKLEHLVDQAFAQNMSLRAAWARLRQARAVVRQQRASLVPWLSGQAGASHQKIDTAAQFGASFPTGPDGQAEPDTSTSFSTYSASLAASYEVDVWGKMRSRWQAAQLDARATRAQAESLAISLTSQIAQNWLSMVYQRARIELLDQQVSVSKKYDELVLLRLSLGDATALDVTQQHQNTEQLRGQLALAHSAERRARHQLAVLVGRPPQAKLGLTTAALPALAPLPDPGIPADLLERRPDVRAALLRVKAADQRTQAAVAERLPQLKLSANLSVQANEIAKLFEQLLWSLSASLTQPIFEGGRLTARIDQAEAVGQEALFNYAQTLLDAIGEVQDALVMEAQQAKFVDRLDAQARSAKRALKLARDRYRRGALGYLRVLDTIQAQQQTEQRLLDARHQRLLARVRLCRGLGGTWTRQLAAPSGDGS